MFAFPVVFKPENNFSHSFPFSGCVSIVTQPKLCPIRYITNIKNFSFILDIRTISVIFSPNPSKNPKYNDRFRNTGFCGGLRPISQKGAATLA